MTGRGGGGVGWCYWMGNRYFFSFLDVPNCFVLFIFALYGRYSVSHNLLFFFPPKTSETRYGEPCARFQEALEHSLEPGRGTKILLTVNDIGQTYE